MNSTQHYLSISTYRSQEEATARDEELVIAAKAGSHAAFGEIQNLYSHRLYKRIVSITRSREDAEDALQDTFLRAYRGLPSFEGRSKFSSWLTRIAINSALMAIRKRRARAEMSFHQQPGIEEDAPSFDIRDEALNPEELCDQKERSCAIHHAIQRLNPKMRAPLHIWISQEHSIKEIAHALGISTACVKSRIQRARKRLIQFPSLRNPRPEVVPADRDALNLRFQHREQPMFEQRLGQDLQR
jgi:RNA polymerase sigma-70 factor (ECF subfamily)